MVFIDAMNKLHAKNGGRVRFSPRLPLGRPLYSPDAGDRTSADVGLELEIEGKNLPSTALLSDIVSPKTSIRWAAIVDGSLRNGGVEYITVGPISAKEIRFMVSSLFDRITATPNCRIENSNRCSTHVHVNVQGYKANVITSILVLWTTFQTPLIRWHGIERMSNHFCLSSRETNAVIDAWSNFLLTGSRPRGDGLKYTALNILPIWRQGSVEFRAGGRPDHADKVVWWAKICNGIVKYAAQHFQNPNDLGYTLSEQGPTRLFRSLLEYCDLGPKTTEKLFTEFVGTDPDFDMTAMEDFRDAQRLIYYFPWDSVMDEINRGCVENPFTRRRI